VGERKEERKRRRKEGEVSALGSVASVMEGSFRVQAI